jgi:exosortase
MSQTPPSTLEEFASAARGVAAWGRRNPIDALLAAGIFAVLAYFFGCYHVFVNGEQTAADWTTRAWNAENDLEYGWLILPAALFIVWWHRAELAAAPKGASLPGLAIAIFGALTFVFSVRTLQPRFAIFALPLLAYGSVRYLWGRATARIVLFPCAFLLFMVPLGFLVSRTVGLQNLTAAVATRLANVLGARVMVDGDNILALNGLFKFEVAGGCSGIRSLTAMIMLAALFVHFTQREWWKKGTIFASSLLFALLGNFVRIFSVILFARYISPRIATGLYHDWSGFIFFPFAVGAMIATSELVNRDWSALLAPAPARPARSPAEAAAPVPGTPAAPREKVAGPISYDY